MPVDDLIMKISEASSIHDLNNLYQTSINNYEGSDRELLEEAYKMRKEKMLQGEVEVVHTKRKMTTDMFERKQNPVNNNEEETHKTLVGIFGDPTLGNSIEFKKSEKRLTFINDRT